MVGYNGKSFKSTKVVSLQKKLRALPLVPLNKRQRNLRNKIQRQLVEEARKSGDISVIDLNVGFM